jgi:hypothetical protein
MLCHEAGMVFVSFHDMPLVFHIHIDELRRVQHLSVAPLTGTPPLEPGIGDALLKAFKGWLSK